MKVLIADDELISRIVVRRSLKNYCPAVTEIEEASDGEDAVEQARKLDADVVLMDIEMPGINGMEAARRIKRWKNECIVIFLTAFADFQYAKEAISIGASEYLVKPIVPEELKEVIEKCSHRLGMNLEKHTVDPSAEISETEEERGSFSESMTGRAGMIMAQAKEYVELHYMDDLTIDSLAQKFGISTNYLNRLFRNCCGMPGKEYLIYIRVEQAKLYLKNPALTIRNVGQMVGYEDPNYFTRIFKKKTGVTPAEFRNQQFFAV